jgi:hypothetical protein
LTRNYFQWACDECLDSGKALPGDWKIQKWADHNPFLVYYDIHKKCKTCGKDFVFSKNEQRYWYEELKFRVQSECVNCLDCRREIRANKPTQKKSPSAVGKYQEWQSTSG